MFVMFSCSLCSKKLDCWLSFHRHFKSLHGIDMQQCTQCTELIPRGVLMVQHMTSHHLVRCSVVLQRTKDKVGKVSKKVRKGNLSHTDRKSSAIETSAIPTCSVSVSRM